MQLREIASIAGQPGLYRILKPARSGVIVESVSETRTRTTVGAAARVSILSEISMFTTEVDGSVPLPQIMKAIFERESGQPIPLSAKSDGADLEAYFTLVLPNWDSDRVYTSDIKKLVTWYNILVRYAPEVFSEVEDASTAQAGDKVPLQTAGESAEAIDESMPESQTATLQSEAATSQQVASGNASDNLIPSEPAAPTSIITPTTPTGKV
jgi:hypothetical protein